MTPARTGMMHGRLLAAALCALLLSACASNKVTITVDSQVPVPVTAKLPLRAGVHYDAAFRQHVYQEDSEDRPDWRIESGASQMALFDQVLSSMFTELRSVDAMPPGAQAAGLDLVLEPKIEEMQFSTPTEMKTDFYEAWIRYQLGVYEPDGSLLTTWRFEGYGKSSDKFLENANEGMNEAINVALRDAGAKLVVKFGELPEIRERVEGR